MAQESTPQFRAVASQMKRSIPGEGMSNDPNNPYGEIQLNKNLENLIIDFLKNQ